MAEMQQSVPTNPIKPKKDLAVISLILGIIGILAWLFPLIGFPVTIVGLIFGINSLKGKKRGIAIAGIILCSIFLLATSVNSIIGAYKGATGQLGQPQDNTSVSAPTAAKGQPQNNASVSVPTAAKDSKSKTPQWNMSDVNVETNGNIAVALNLLENITPEQLKRDAIAIDPELAMKSPWQYYGKLVKFSGYVSIIQDYPPNSDTSNALNKGKEVGEIVFTADGANLFTIIDYLHLGSTGDVKTVDYVTVYGLIVGQVEVQNKLGGTTTQLVVIGKAFDKQINQQ